MKVESLNLVPTEPTSRNPDILKQVLIKTGEIPALAQFTRAIFRPGQIDPSHSHSYMYEIFLVEKGIGEIKVGDQTISLNAGTFVTLNPGEVHGVSNTSDQDLILLTLGILKNT